jgi:hypothetical protein
MDPDQVKAAIEALKNNDAAAALTILEALIVSAAGGNAAEVPPEGEPTAAADPLAADAEPPPAKLAALKALRTFTGCTSLGEAVETLKAWKADRDQDATNAAALEETSRAELVGELVKLGYETPATAWADADKKKPAAHLAALSVVALRARVVAFKGAPKAAPGFKPPTSTETLATEGGRAFKTKRGDVTLSASEIANCEAAGAKLEEYAENKAIREAARRK